MKKTLRVFSLFLLWISVVSHTFSVWCQQASDIQEPVFSCDEMMHDFGRVRETNGYAVHEFFVKNTGTAPLIISHVLTTCGCAQPEWSRNPIEPGKEGFVIVSYDMVNRPGPFLKNITAYTNERTLRHIFTIKGDVIPKPQTLNVLFKDTIGVVQMEQAAFDFNAVRLNESQSFEIWIQNFGEEDLTLTVSNVPEYLTVTVPDYLESNFPDRMVVEINSSGVSENLKGRQLAQLSWITESKSGEKTSKTIPVSVNFIDDFRRMTPVERTNSPSLQISTKLLDYGKLKKKRVSKELSITNTGKSSLRLHSISVDDAKVAEITGIKKQELQPEETLKLKIFVNPKDFINTFSTDLYIVSNDPQSPVQSIWVTAEK